MRDWGIFLPRWCSVKHNVQQHLSWGHLQLSKEARPERKLTGKADVKSVGETKIHGEQSFEDNVKSLSVFGSTCSFWFQDKIDVCALQGIRLVRGRGQGREVPWWGSRHGVFTWVPVAVSGMGSPESLQLLKVCSSHASISAHGFFFPQQNGDLERVLIWASEELGESPWRATN